MTTVVFLVRHAAHDDVGRYLAGRTPGIRLGPAGLAQSRRLAERLRRERFAAIHTSPRERTRETAAAIGGATSIEPEVAADLDEVDFGEAWCGRTFEDLDGDQHWRCWNAARSLARTPGGESMHDVQGRILRHIDGLRERLHGEAAVLVSHSDVIKAALAYYLGLPLDAWPRFDIEPASISTVAVGEWGATVKGLNEVVW